MDDRTNRLANVLIDTFGVAQGDRVALLAANRMEVAEVLAAVHKAGAVYSGLNFRFQRDELTGALDNAEPRVLLRPASSLPKAGPWPASCGIAVIDLDDDGPRRVRGAARGALRRRAPPRMHDVRPARRVLHRLHIGSTGPAEGRAVRPRGHDPARDGRRARVRDRRAVALPDADPAQLQRHITIAAVLWLGGAALGFADSRGFDPDRFADEVTSAGRSRTRSWCRRSSCRVLDRLDPTTSSLATLTTIGYGSSPIAPDRLGELVRPVRAGLHPALRDGRDRVDRDDAAQGRPCRALAERPAAPGLVRARRPS